MEMFYPLATLFFADPSKPGRKDNINGILHLLRVDISTCFKHHASFPAAMAILAGVDLLGKFFTGDDSIGKVGERFRKFTKTYFDVSGCEAEVIYQFRNALLHSFGLFSKTRKKEYAFRLTQRRRPLLSEGKDGRYEIDILKLNDAFEGAVRRYLKDLNKDEDLQKKFCRMFPRYGAMYVGKIS